MDEFIIYLVVALVVVSVGAAVGYVVLRRLFMRGADRMARHIEHALNQIAADPRVSAAGAAASRLASGRLTNLGAYAAAQGISEEQARAELSRSIERLARLMDSAVKLPIVGGVGLDALLGLVPVAGDAASAVVSISLIARSVRYGLPRDVITKMLANVIVDLLLGALPVVGDLADVWFKANERNLALLNEFLGDEARDVIDAEVVSRS